MNKQINFSSLSLIVLLIVMICSTVSVLSLMNSYIDYQMSQTQANTTDCWIECHNQGQKWISQQLQKEDGIYTIVIIDDEGYCLDIELEIENGNYQLLKYDFYKRWNNDTRLNVWKGE